MATIEFKNTILKYKDTVAIDDINLEIEGNKVVGLLGRNGAGKTSLLSMLASFRQPTSGTVTIDGEEPFENKDIMEKCFMIWANQKLQDNGTILKTLEFCNNFRPNFDMDYGLHLIKMFGLNPKQNVKKLSQGMLAALNVTCGLASRCPITVFDEAYLGLDAANRNLFYKELMKDYLEHPRTIIISTHYIQEVETLLEEVVILDEGRILIHSDSESIRSKAITITGNIESVDRIQGNYEVINTQVLGNTKAIVAYGDFSEADLMNLREQNLEIGNPSLQDLFVYQTKKGGKNDAE